MSTNAGEDEWGFRIGMVLFAFLIPLLFALAVMLSPRTSVLQGGEGGEQAEGGE